MDVTADEVTPVLWVRLVTDEGAPLGPWQRTLHRSATAWLRQLQAHNTQAVHLFRDTYEVTHRWWDPTEKRAQRGWTRRCQIALTTDEPRAH